MCASLGSSVGPWCTKSSPAAFADSVRRKPDCFSGFAFAEDGPALVGPPELADQEGREQQDGEDDDEHSTDGSVHCLPGTCSASRAPWDVTYRVWYLLKSAVC